MPKRVTSPKRKTKMASKSRIPKGSKEAKEWNLKMQEAKRRKKELRERREKRERSKVLRSPSKRKGILKKDRNNKPSPRRVKFSKRLENFPLSPGTIDPTSVARK